MISAGDLDRRIDLQSFTATRDDYNEPVQTWANYASSLPAMMEFNKVDESEQAERIYAERGLFFTIRWRSDVEPEHRIVFEGDNYQIIGRPREIGRRQFLKMQARLIE